MGSSSRRPEFNSPYPYSSSQWSVTLVPRDPMPSSGFLSHRHTCGIQTYIQANTSTYKTINWKKNKKEKTNKQWFWVHFKWELMTESSTRPYLVFDAEELVVEI